MSEGKIFATILLHSRVPLIWYSLGSLGEGGVCGQNICLHVAALMIPFYMIYSMTIF